jgi:LytS/YehU family sensor histidine kinase
MALLASSGALLVAERLRLKPATGVLPNLGRSLAIGFGVSAVVLLVEWLYHRLEVERRDAERRNLERERALRLAAEARWNSLESRLRPHFLFNALSSLRELMHQDLARADKMLQSFAELLRFSLNSAQSSLIPLREELEMVRNYLSIEQIRLGARLRWSVTAPPDSGEAAVPAMSLLSLVENAVKHGISPQRRGGRVDVTVERGENALRVCVRDDGPGIAVAEWPAGHGLAMLHERLHALYGAESDLRVLPSATGAMVEMRIPATQQVRKGAESEPSALLRRG